jgi:hypothetical protein
MSEGEKEHRRHFEAETFMEASERADAWWAQQTGKHLIRQTARAELDLGPTGLYIVTLEYVDEDAGPAIDVCANQA